MVWETNLSPGNLPGLWPATPTNSWFGIIGAEEPGSSAWLIASPSPNPPRYTSWGSVPYVAASTSWDKIAGHDGPQRPARSHNPPRPSWRSHRSGQASRSPRSPSPLLVHRSHRIGSNLVDPVHPVPPQGGSSPCPGSVESRGARARVSPRLPCAH
jgi:hypothetical protein